MAQQGDCFVAIAPRNDPHKKQMLGSVLFVLAAYLLGAIPTAYIAGRVVKGIDIRRYGSGNAGPGHAGLRSLGRSAAKIGTSRQGTSRQVVSRQGRPLLPATCYLLLATCYLLLVTEEL